MQKARDRALGRSPIALSRLVDTRFQGLFTPLAGVLFAFPSRYWFAIGRQGVFSLGRWSSQLPTGFLGPRGTQGPPRRPLSFHRRGYHALWPAFPGRSVTRGLGDSVGPLPRPPGGPTTPHVQRRQACTRTVWAPPRSLATTCGISGLISFPQGTEMFQFPWLAAHRLWIQRWLLRLDPEGVSPFGHPRIDACLRLPVAYRS
jgi:hypothetical protein